MKVVQLSYSDQMGGAGIACYRIHRALLAAGIDSRLWCLRKKTGDPTVETIYGAGQIFLNRAANFLLSKATQRLGKDNYSFNLLPLGAGARLQKCDADVVNLHWVDAETISVPEIGRIRQPAVWTLHSFWPVMGIGSYPQIGARSFADPGAEPGRLAAWARRRKMGCWRRFRPTLVGVSRWAKEMAMTSPVASGWRGEAIPNCLDLDTFRPRPRTEARAAFGLPQDRYLVLFGAQGNRDPRKGGDLLVDALARFRESGAEGVDLVTFGDAALDPALTGAEGCRHLGFIGSPARLAELYSAADVMCVPSRQETFGQTASEALACGTPVVTFGGSGLSEVVDHGVNGWVAEPFDTGSFAEGIRWAQAAGGTPAGSGALAAAARAKAEKEFSPGAVAGQYAALYREILEFAGEGGEVREEGEKHLMP